MLYCVILSETFVTVMGMSLAYAQRCTYIGIEVHLYAHEAEAELGEADGADEAAEAEA